MGLESFYFGVKTAIFSSRGSAPHPAAGAGPWADPRVRPQRPQNLELGYRQKSPLPVRPRKKGRSKEISIKCMWPHHPFANQCAADPTVRSSSSASMVTLQSFSKCIGFAPRRPKLRTGQNEAAERIRQ